MSWYTENVEDQETESGSEFGGDSQRSPKCEECTPNWIGWIGGVIIGLVAGWAGSAADYKNR